MAKGDKETSSESKSSSGSSTGTNILLIILIVLVAVLVQQNLNSKSEIDSQVLEQVFQKWKAELKKDVPVNEIKSSGETRPKEDDIVIEPTTTRATTTKAPTTTKPTRTENKVVIDDKKNEPEPELRLTGDQPLVLDGNKLKVELKQETKKPTTTTTTTKAPTNQKPKETKNIKFKDESDVPDEIKNFKSKKISEIKPKKMWIPIPGSNGGHRRVPPIEVKAGKEHMSSVKVWLFEEFLSQEECDQLIKAHEKHLAEYSKQKPIICFDSLDTLRQHLTDLNRQKWADVVDEETFTPGTTCLNQTFSRQLEKWGLKWSFSTAFYPGESKFSTILGKRIEDATRLNETHGGKFQITSYPFDVGYKSHTDCVVSDQIEKRDRYATFLIYLNSLGAEGGGETVFPELDIKVAPREARALTWTSMDYNSAKCEAKSIHHASKVTHPVTKKYVIQRWYYLENFYSLGKRMEEARLPQRPPLTAKVSCDRYDQGGCRMYDEWGPDHLIDYRQQYDKKF